MKSEELLSILQVTEKLKCMTRHCYTSSGRHESVAEHCWQMTLMAMLLENEFRAEFPEVDMNRVLRMCLIHDLGEAFTGDIPTFQKTGEDDAKEEDILSNWVNSFPLVEREQWKALYKEMNAQESLEAKIYKSMDKMEAVIEHNMSDISTWLPLEYKLQLTYGEKEVQVSEVTKELKSAVDQMTREKIAKHMRENFDFRQVRPEDAETAAEIEAICFPPSEACTLPIMKERVALAGDSFLVAIDREKGKMAGFVNALCTNENTLRDELFTDTQLHNPDGKNVMICSVAVLPEYRGRGIAREMVRLFLDRERQQGKSKAILTCVPGKVQMYEKFGFTDSGESESTWGGEKWHEMECIL